MSEQFVIQWKSKTNGRAGRGSKSFVRAEAEKLAQELNTEYPEIEHSAVPLVVGPANISPPPGTTPPSSSAETVVTE